jgi:transglutaminase-like putative cysteine protease
MKLHIVHHAVCQYTQPASYSIQILKLTPHRNASQIPISWRLETPGRRIEQVDAFGNLSHLLTLEGTHNAIVIHAEGVVEIDAGSGGQLREAGPLAPLAYVPATRLTRGSAAIGQLARLAFPEGLASEAGLQRLMELVNAQVRCQPGSTLLPDSASDVLLRGEGVCQDQAHVAIAACRAAGIPARYVSGHVLTDAAEALSHAWLDVWLAEQHCWQSCDITYRRFTSPRLCRMAVGRDYLDAAPVRGMRRGGGREQPDVQVQVQMQVLEQMNQQQA